MLEKIRKVKEQIGKLTKNARNPHFKNTYIDLNGLIEAVEPLLLENGLVLIQPIENNKVVSKILDIETNEFLVSEIDLPPFTNPQQIGSAITYFRRYTLQSLLTLQADDDDGNASSGIPTQKPKPKLTKQEAEKHLALKTAVDKLKGMFELSQEQEHKYNEQLKQQL